MMSSKVFSVAGKGVGKTAFYPLGCRVWELAHYNCGMGKKGLLPPERIAGQALAIVRIP
jgi:hypothetical protein